MPVASVRSVTTHAGQALRSLRTGSKGFSGHRPTKGKRNGSVEPEAVDERSRRIETKFDWPRVVAALLVISII